MEDPPLMPQAEQEIEKDAKAVLSAYKSQTKVNEVPNCTLITDVTPPVPVQEMMKNESRNLHAPGGYMTKEELFSEELQEICAAGPIVFIRNIADALKLDLTLFSSLTLEEMNPEHSFEVRTQLLQDPCENWKIGKSGINKKSWDCYSIRSHMTIAEYVKYQKKHYFDHLPWYLKRNLRRSYVMRLIHDDAYNMEFSYKSDTYKGETVIFATNVDLSDEKKWEPQLKELSKLPPFVSVKSDDNMLNYVDYKISGVNTVQLYMSVPGGRITGHQGDNNLCTVNINCGPGFCEWFVVPYEYWGVMFALCKRARLDYLRDSWWPPDLDVLYSNNIPVYKCLQRTGDLVWVNAGCVQWMQAVGWCNSVAWNVGPLSATQYRLAITRYEWNKLQKVQSIVPMVQLSWNLAGKVKVSDPRLFELMKNCLRQTMIQCYCILELVKSKGVEVRFHGHDENEVTYYCERCKTELFNLLFTKKERKRGTNYIVLCYNCVTKQSSTLNGCVCLQQRSMHELMDIYDNFIHTHAANETVVQLNN